MTTPQPESGYRVTAFTLTDDGSVAASVGGPNSWLWYVTISPDGDWFVCSQGGATPDRWVRSAIMAAVSHYSLRRTFGGAE